MRDTFEHHTIETFQHVSTGEIVDRLTDRAVWNCSPLTAARHFPLRPCRLSSNPAYVDIYLPLATLAKAGFVAVD